MRYVKQFLEYFEKFPTFTASDVKLFLSKKGGAKDYYKVFIHNLIKSGGVLQIKRGSYTLHDDPFVAGFAFSPFYYGMETALTYYKLWDYATPISIVTTKRIKQRNITLLGRNATVRKIQGSKFFGYTMVQYKEDLYIPMANLEKTLIDSVYFRAPFSKEIYSSMEKQIDRKRLDGYLKRYSAVVKRRVADMLKAPDSLSS